VKTYSRFLESSLDDKLDKYVSNEIKKRKLARFPVNATDDYKMKKGKPAFKFPSPTGEMIIKVWLRPMMKPAKSHTKAFNYELDDK
tara:strand:+ start:98 stop:355 length:258 start_codon:yes stop_codon:yes gene_type:complete